MQLLNVMRNQTDLTIAISAVPFLTAMVLRSESFLAVTIALHSS